MPGSQSTDLPSTKTSIVLFMLLGGVRADSTLGAAVAVAAAGAALRKFGVAWKDLHLAEPVEWK